MIRFDLAALATVLGGLPAYPGPADRAAPRQRAVGVGVRLPEQNRVREQLQNNQQDA